MQFWCVRNLIIFIQRILIHHNMSQIKKKAHSNCKNAEMTDISSSNMKYACITFINSHNTCSLKFKLNKLDTVINICLFILLFICFLVDCQQW